MSIAATAATNLTPHERLVVGIWREILRLDAIDLDQRFFEIGGNSRLLLQVRARLTEALGMKIGIVSLLENSTVRALARHLDGMQR